MLNLNVNVNESDAHLFHGNFLQNVISLKALNDGVAVYETGFVVNNVSGFLGKLDKWAHVRVLTEADGGDFSGTFTRAGEQSTASLILGHKATGAISVKYRGVVVYINIWTTDKDHALEFLSKTGLKEYVEPPYRPQGKVYALVTGPDGFDFAAIGTPGLRLNRLNYNKAVLDSFDYIVEQLATKEPNGRIVLLNGTPGCGKTYAVRGIIDALPNQVYIFISSGQIRDLVKPEFFTALLSMSSRAPNGICLILEDADNALVKRTKENMDAVSALLNFGDGILGASLNLRILATTNAESPQLDAAITRPGRMLAHVEVGPLSKSEAETLLCSFRKGKDKLSKGEAQDFLGTLGGKMVKESFTVAELYAEARKQNLSLAGK